MRTYALPVLVVNPMSLGIFTMPLTSMYLKLNVVNLDEINCVINFNKFILVLQNIHIQNIYSPTTLIRVNCVKRIL